MKLALGTVQFGMDYGRFNPDGRVPRDEAARVLRLAAEHGIDTLDTAQAYGESEALLGELGAAADFRLVTKIVVRPRDGPREVRDAVDASRLRLRCERLYGVLIHNAPQLEARQRAMALAALDEMRSDGTLGRAGVSVYDAATARAWAESEPITLVQLPLSVLDQRALHDRSLDALARAGVEVHARSLFLQGLVLQEPATLVAPFEVAREAVERFHRDARGAGSTPAAAALGFVFAMPQIERAVIGVRSTGELEQALAGTGAAPALDWSRYDLSDHPELLDPSTWPGPSRT